jgi:hypothetical protein
VKAAVWAELEVAGTSVLIRFITSLLKEKIMDQITDRSTFNEMGLLTLDNGVVALIDLHHRRLLGVSEVDRQPVINNSLLLAKAAFLFHEPSFSVFSNATRRGQQS